MMGANIVKIYIRIPTPMGIVVLNLTVTIGSSTITPIGIGCVDIQ